MSHPTLRPPDDDHRAWVVGRIREAGVRSRRLLYAFERDTRSDAEGRVTSADVRPYGWGPLRDEALSPEVDTPRAADVSGLDWDDEEGDTQPTLMPFPAVPEGHVLRGVSTYHDGEGKPVRQWVKTSKPQEAREEVLRRLLAELPEAVPAREGALPPPSEPTDEDLLAVYPMGDPHVGMLAWAPETGENFDLKIATRLMHAAIDELTSHTPRARQALICNVGDFYHSDDPSNRTRRSGNELDVDGRWFKVLRVGIDVMVYTIDSALRSHEHVAVVNCIGNHDDTSSLMLSVALDHHYRNEPRVEIVCSPAKCIYRRFGKVLIGVTHGDTIKLGDLEAVMAADVPEDWGATTYRTWLTGHIHHKRVIESRGSTAESFRTLAAKDAWHAGQGYRSRRDMNRITMHREWGEVSRSTVSAAYLQARMEAQGEAA